MEERKDLTLQECLDKQQEIIKHFEGLTKIEIQLILVLLTESFSKEFLEENDDSFIKELEVIRQTLIKEKVLVFE